MGASATANELATLTKDELVQRAVRFKNQALAFAKKAEQGMDVAAMSAVGSLGAVAAGVCDRYQPTVPWVDNVPLAPALGLGALALAAFSKPAQTHLWTAAGIGLSAPFIAKQTTEILR